MLLPRVIEETKERINKLLDQVNESATVVDVYTEQQLHVMIFMSLAGQKIAFTPVDPTTVPEETTELRFKLHNEELQELHTAMEEDNIVEIADAIADMMYVLLGTAATYGIPTGLIFDTVHMSNMSKVALDGKIHKNADGKVLKPEHYKAPEIAQLLAAIQTQIDKAPETAKESNEFVKKMMQRITMSQLDSVHKNIHKAN